MDRDGHVFLYFIRIREEERIMIIIKMKILSLLLISSPFILQPLTWSSLDPEPENRRLFSLIKFEDPVFEENMTFEK